MMAKGDNVVLSPSEIGGRRIRIVASRLESEIPPGSPPFIQRHSENEMICEAYFVQGTGDFAADYLGDKLMPLFVNDKGSINCRITGRRAGSYMLVHLDIYQPQQ